MIHHLNDALAGRYRIEDLIGRGGMATVYRAIDLRHDRVVAIKVMNPEFAETVGRDRFLREIRVTASLTHPHILALYDSGEADGLLFYVMPFVEGISLRQRLATQQSLPLDEVRKITREVADALSYAASRGIVHRDIKPENILLAGYGESRGSWNTLVADFGIAAPTLTRSEHFTGTGVAVGSPQYMSPEQALGERVDERSDIWSLGCVVYEMIEGLPPRGVPAFKTSRLPASTGSAVLRALAADPKQRFGDARDLASAIEDQSQRNQRRRTFTWVAAAAVLALAVAAFSTTWRRPASTPRPAMTKDSVAAVLYQRGRTNLTVRSLRSIAEAYGQFSGAIERDSTFALAWSGLARAAQLAFLWGAPVPGQPPDSLVAIALAASQRAVTLDSTASEVWVVRARVMEIVEPTSRTAVLSDLRRALAADSLNSEAWFALARARDELLDSTGARIAYERAVRLTPSNIELLGFFALHYTYANTPRLGMRWADSALAIDPTYQLGRGAALILALNAGDVRLAEQHLIVLQRVTRGRERVNPLSHAARLAALKGDGAAARRFAQMAEQLVDSATLTKHESVFLAAALSAAGDTAQAYRWLAAYSPRNDAHFQLHLYRDPAIAWVQDERYRHLLPR